MGFCEKLPNADFICLEIKKENFKKRAKGKEKRMPVNLLFIGDVHFKVDLTDVPTVDQKLLKDDNGILRAVLPK